MNVIEFPTPCSTRYIFLVTNFSPKPSAAAQNGDGFEQVNRNRGSRDGQYRGRGRGGDFRGRGRGDFRGRGRGGPRGGGSFRGRRTEES